MTERLTVRRVEVADVAALRALRLEALTEAPEAFGSTYQREVDRTEAEWHRWLTLGGTFFLEADGVPRGLVSGMRDPQDPQIVFLMAMWVHPRLRGSGAADLLVARNREWAGAVGATRVRLTVVSTNERARRLYARNGFQLTGRQSTLEDGRVELQMERPV